MNLNREINSGHYGIEQIAKKYCGLKKSKHIIGIWQHGVFLPEILHYPDQLTSHEIPLLIRKRYPFFVANQHNKDFLRANGYRNVHAIGMPIVYAKVQPKIKIRDSLLLLPDHSVEWHPQKESFEEYALFVEEIIKNFSRVTLSLHKHDYTQSNIELFKKYKNLKVILGASEWDLTSLERSANLFNSHEFACANTLNSGLIYAGFFGCKISIAGPKSHNQQILNAAIPALIDNSELLNKVNYGFAQIQEKYNFLRLPSTSLKHSKSYVAICSDLVGFQFKKEPKELVKILGLTHSNLIKKYALHSITRIAQFVEKSQKR
jgi:hypothetical protein